MNTFIINSADLQHLNERDAIIRIQTDITLPSSTTLGANSVLVFENGAMINANSEVTLTGSSAFISHLASFVHGCTLTINRLQSDGHIVRTVQEIAYQPAPNS